MYMACSAQTVTRTFYFSIYIFYHFCYERIITDKFNLMVVSLNQTNMATAEDKLYGIDTWARLFKATTWEEIKMITKDNPSMNSTAESIYMSNSDENIRELCRRREDAIAHENYQKRKLQEFQEKVDILTDENARLRKLLEDHNIQVD